MSFTAGTFSLIAGNPVVTATTISSTWANNTLSDIASGLSTCVLKDGTQTITAGIGFIAGSSANPSIYFTTDTSSGFYRPAANQLGFLISGAQVAKFTSTGLTVTGAIISSATVSAVSGLFSTSVTTPIVDSGSTGSLLLKTNNGTPGFQVQHVTNGVNQWGTFPGITGSPATLVALSGTDADVNANISMQGTGVLSVLSNSSTQFQVLHTVSATSNITITGSATSKPILTTNTGYMRIGAVGQLTFPATQDASSDANTLDDYEEGTFTPQLTFGGATGNLTYTTQSGRATKIGRETICSINIVVNSKGTATGTARVSGFPVTANAVINSYGAAHFGGMAAELSALYLESNTAGGDSVTITGAKTSVSSTSVSSLDDTHFTGGSIIRGTIILSGT